MAYEQMGCPVGGLAPGGGERIVVGAFHSVPTSDGATAASTVTYLLPVVAIALGVLVLNETITALTLAGIALALGGVALTRVKRTQPEPEAQSDSPVTWRKLPN